MSYSRSTIHSGTFRPVSTTTTQSVISSKRYAPMASAASVYAGAGGSGSRISVSRASSLGSGFAGGMGGGYGGGFSSSFSFSGSGVVQNEKETMQELNDRLANYLEKVRSLEADNRKLEIQIREYMEKKGPSTRDWSHYFDIIEDLKNQVRRTQRVSLVLQSNAIWAPKNCRGA